MPDQDPFAKYGGTSVVINSDATSAPTPSRASAPLRQSNPQSQTYTGDPFAKYGGTTVFSGSSDAPKPTAAPASRRNVQVPSYLDPNAPWYRASWDWLNSPLLELNKENQGGVIGGAKDVASGFTSPLSIGLTVGTFGSGALLRGLGVTAEELPVAIRGLKGLLSAGLTLQQAHQVIQETPRVLDALKDGDYGTAKRLAVHVAAGGVFTALGANELRGELAGPKPTEGATSLRQEFGRYQGDVETGNRAAQLHKQALEAELPKSADRGAIYRYITAGGSRAKLIERYNAVAESAGRPKQLADFIEKIYHGSPSEAVTDISQLRGGEFGRPAVAGVGNYFSYEPEVAGSFAGPHGEATGGRVVAGVLNPEANLLDANKPLPDALREKIEAHIGEQLPKDANYLQAVNAIRERGSLQPDAPAESPASLADRLKTFQRVVAQEGYDGVRYVAEYGGKPRRVGMIFDEGVAAHPFSEIVRPSVPNRIPEPFDAKLAELAQKKILANKPKTYVDKLLSQYQGAIDLSPEERAIADKIRQSYASDFERAHESGVLNSTVEDYANRLWKQPDNPAANTIRNEAKNGRFSTNVSMARHRVFGSETEGELLGYELRSTDPIELSAYNKAAIRRAVASRDFADRVRELRASDGRPMLALSGTGSPLNGEEAGTLVNPFRLRKITIPETEVYRLQRSGELDRMIGEGSITRLKNGGYAWNPSDYLAVAHPAFRDWRFATGDSEGAPVFVKGELRSHPEVSEQLKRYIGVEEPLFGRSKVARAITGASQESKKLLFSLSPFHLIQEHVRAFMAGVSPFDYSNNFRIEGNPVLEQGVRHGLTIAPDYKASELFSEGLSSGDSKVIGKIPGVRDVNNFIHHLIFEKYIPGRKAAAFQQLVKDYRAAYPRWDEGKVYSEAAAHVNELFGGINWKLLGRSARTQDLFRTVALAPDWTEANLRLIARSFGASGAVARKQLFKLGAAIWVAARVGNYLTSGKSHFETPFGVAVPQNDGREKVYTLRSPITDAVHFLTDPRGFGLNRLSPAVKSAVEIGTGRDVRGRSVTPADAARNAISNATPIPLQGVVQYFNNEGEDRSGFDQMLQSLGAENYQYRTEAEKLASQLASGRAPTGPVDQAQLAHHLRLLRAEDEVRSGQKPDLEPFTPRERHEIVKNSKLTPLQARFARLPMKDALQVWDAATAAERSELVEELLKKKNSFLKNERTLKTPEELRADAVYNRVLRITEPKRAANF